MLKTISLAIVLAACSASYAEARHHGHHHGRNGYSRHMGYHHNGYAHRGNRWSNPLASRYGSQPRRSNCAEIANASQFCP